MMDAGRWKLKKFENKHEFHELKIEIPNGMTRLCKRISENFVSSSSRYNFCIIAGAITQKPLEVTVVVD